MGDNTERVCDVLKAMGYEPELKLMPFKRCLIEMREGRLPLILPCIDNEDRRQYLRFSGNVFPIMTHLWRNVRSGTRCWEEYEELKGRLIGVSQGYAYGKEWDAAVASGIFDLEVVSGVDPELTHFKMALFKRTDMFMCERSLGEYIKARHAPRFENIAPCPKPVGPVRYFRLGASKKYFQDRNLDVEDFLARFNAELSKLDQP